jgi:hypothetical protein
VPNIAVQVEPATGAPSDVEYRWDTDTDILSAHLRTSAAGEGLSGSVELAGSDGSWVILDVTSGRISGVEVAVWPDVRQVPTLAPPAEIEDARVLVPAKRSQPGVAALEVEGTLVAESDQSERTIHFKLGAPRQTRTIRVARDILLDLDGGGQIAGLWLLNVPPFPADA